MPEITPSKYLVMAGWDDAVHLDEKTKAELLASTPPFLREARSKGIPSLGSGAIYPIPESEITCSYFTIPAHWPRAYGMDVGWNVTAAIWLAWDQTTDTAYAYAEHYRKMAEPTIHAMSIKQRGEWISGVCDPAARSSSQLDGEKLLDVYRALGLKLELADNAVDAGIYDVWTRLSLGKLKIMTHLVNTLTEYRLYRRDENGRIVKKLDHAMDAMRYAVRSGKSVARVQAPQEYDSGSDGVDYKVGY